MTAERFIYFFADGCSEIEGIEGCAAGGVEAAGLHKLLGGKGASLHAMTAMGFRVPPGFTIVTSGCDAYYSGGETWPNGLHEELAAALARLEEVTGKKLGDTANPLLVAVRSGAAVSMPGMMDTVLNVGTRAGVVAAVERVFRSWQSERAVAYRQQKGIVGQYATAVTVQEMCPAQLAGVAFTADPATGEPAVIVEAVRGLGEDLVSGSVTPDRYRLARPGLDVVSDHVTGNDPLLSPGQIRQIASVSIELESRFGYALDIEWALADDEVSLLQARAVRRAQPGTSASDLLTQEAQKLRRFGGQGCSPGASLRRSDSTTEHSRSGIFVRHNLDETLCYPTPMTWDILGEFFTGKGGFGSLYRTLGYQPSQRVMKEGFFVTACGRVYADLTRAAELFFPTELIRYDAEAVRSQPDLLNEAPQQWETKGASPIAVLRALYLCWRSGRRVKRARREFVNHFCCNVLPPYLQWCRQKERQDLSTLDLAQLLEELKHRVEIVLGRFAPNALELSLLAGIAYAELREFLERRLGDVPGRQVTQDLVSFLENDMSVDQNRALDAAGRGELTWNEFLDRFGHRVAGEMELARPRWRENAEVVQQMIDSRRHAAPHLHARTQHRKKAVEQEEYRLKELLGAEGGTELVLEFRRRLVEARALLPYRENGKHYWMLGYDLVRRVLVELDRRLQLEGAIFYLTRAELSKLAAGGGSLNDQHRERLRARREEERLARSISLPHFITADDLERMSKGRTPENCRTDDLATENAVVQGTPIAGGIGEGRAWLCKAPSEQCPVRPPYVLVTSSTDPGWTPLLAGAAALVVERGGVLSHGAIVCRDFGVPALVLPDAVASLSTGELLRVDGTAGTLTRCRDLAKNAGRAETETTTRSAPSDISDCHIPPEPYVRPVKAHLAWRVLTGLTVAIMVSFLLVGVPQIRAAIVPLTQLAYDWTLRHGFTPFWSIVFASASAAAVGILIQMAILDRRQLRQMRMRLKWYREQLKQAAHRRALAPPDAHLAERDVCTLSTLRRRHGQASSERSLELLRPIGWSFLPLCLAYVWVMERFPAEPIRPGSSFSITAYFRPREANNYLRYARFDVPAIDSSVHRDHNQRVSSATLRLLDNSYQKLQPNHDDPARGPYKVTWPVEAVSVGSVTVAVIARDERWEQEVLITDERRFAPATAVRHAGSDMHPAGEITEVRVDYARVRVRLPDVVYRLLDRLARGATRGRGITPDQAASAPLVLFLSSAVVFALTLQRIAGLR